jgi:hypothetical protein
MHYNRIFCLKTTESGSLATMIYPFMQYNTQQKPSIYGTNDHGRKCLNRLKNKCTCASVQDPHSSKLWKLLRGGGEDLLYIPLLKGPSANKFSASQEIPHILWNQKVHSTFTSARHLSLSWADSIQYIPPHPTSWTSILISSSHLHLVSQMVSFPHVSPPKPCKCPGPKLLL